MIVIEYVKKTFPDPIDQWALGEAQKVMEKYAMKKKGVSVFPVEKIHQLLSKVCVNNELLDFMYSGDYELWCAGGIYKNKSKHAFENCFTV